MNRMLPNLLMVSIAILIGGCGGEQTSPQATSSPTVPAARAVETTTPVPLPATPTPATPTVGVVETATLSPTATGSVSPTHQIETVRFGLDWTPNTNHTGVYVAQKQGYYREQGLHVEILPAQEGGTVEQLIAAGRLDFGVSIQEAMTHARVEGIPIVSIAAIIQHNTSGFMSRASAGITTPAHFAGKKYGAFGYPAIERATIRGLMKCAGVEDQFDTVEFVDIGSSDFFVATERGDVDFVWVFRGWTWIEAEIRGIPTNIIMMNDLHCIPDYYTPLIATSERMIAEKPDLVRRFVHATSRGYQFAIAHPDQASAILLEAVPELNAELVRRSQQYLSKQYQADAPRWGEQRVEIWRDYAAWMAQNGLIPRMIEPEKAFTNEFLP